MAEDIFQNNDSSSASPADSPRGRSYSEVLAAARGVIGGESGRRILTVLQEEGLIDKSQVETLQKESKKQKKSIDDLINEMKLVSGEVLAKVRSRQLNVPYVDLIGRSIPKEVLNTINPETVKAYDFVVFDKMENVAKVAMVDPANYQALEALDYVLRQQSLQSEIFVTTKESIDAALRQYSGISEEVGEALEGATIELDKDVPRSGEDLKQFVEQAPVAKAVNMILQNAVSDRASDVHIEPTEMDVRVRYRVDGVLRTVLVLSKDVLSALVSRIKIMSNLKIDETRVPQDGRFHLRMEDKEIDFRVSTLPTVNGEKVVLRILDRSAGILKLAKLGLQGLRLEQVKEAIKKPHGLFLVTGPTGAGKSTTLYSVLGILNEPSVNIVTLEDPVEYFVEGVSQSQINPDVGLTFASGLRSVLRQDPDIVMVGEIRDQETAEMAVHAALTGHIVLSTLHTNSSFGSIPRLVDMGIEPFLLASSLNVVVAQRLVRRLCPHCRVKRKVEPSEAAVIMKEWGAIPPAEKQALDLKLENPLQIYSPKGCPKCKDGFRGRLGIFEVLLISEKIKEGILQRASETKIKSLARDEGLITMMEDGIIKVLQGETTVEEVLRSTRD